MIRPLRSFLMSVLLVAAAFAADQNIQLKDYPADHKIRVACVGDSITFGAGIHDHKHDTYPADLGRLLGDRFDVKNFGHNGATLLKHGDLPYWKVREYPASKSFEPDVVIIMLGTNDTKPQNWKHKDQYVGDYKDLVEQYKSLKSHPKIWIMLPVPAVHDTYGINEKGIKEQRPMIQQVAAAEHVATIDLHDVVDKAEWFIHDGIHPNEKGAAIMAKFIAKSLNVTK